MRLHKLRASPPLRIKRTLQALWRGLAQKSAPPFLPGLLKLAMALQTSGSTHYPPGWALLLRSPNSGTSSTWDLWIVPLLGWSHFTRNIPDGFSGWRANMQGKGGGVPPWENLVHAWSPSKHISRVSLAAQGWRCSYTTQIFQYAFSDWKCQNFSLIPGTDMFPGISW
jgi:hypothetical protein